VCVCVCVCVTVFILLFFYGLCCVFSYECCVFSSDVVSWDWDWDVGESVNCDVVMRSFMAALQKIMRQRQHPHADIDLSDLCIMVQIGRPIRFPVAYTST